MDSSKIPDNTIEQQADRFVVPVLNDIGDYAGPDDQDAFDNAVIAYTAERAFASWLTFTRLRDREIETFLDPEQYMEDLKERTNNSLKVLGATRPPQIPNHVETIKHDGEWRRAKRDRVWHNP